MEEFREQAMSVMRQYRKRAEALVADSPFFSNPSGDLQVHFFRHELIKQRALLLYFHRQLNVCASYFPSLHPLSSPSLPPLS